MTLLPIAARELRVASRQGGTYWTRVAAAGLAILVSAGFLVAWAASPMAAGGNTGQFLFSTLKWLCFAFVCSTGLFLTADTLSEEKREGTLGLLFLTDLRGYDVVLGKLVATSLKSFYGLLAFFPVLGLTLMAGGVSGTEFWRTLLALCNALFFSLASGVLVSTFSRDTFKAISGVMAFCVIALGAPPLLDLWRADWDWTRFEPHFLFASPAYAFAIAPQSSSRVFWLAVVWPQAGGWVCLALASFFVSRTWQEKSTSSQKKQVPRRWRWRFAGEGQRRKWLEANPLLWLAARDQWLTRAARVVFLLFGGLGVYFWFRGEYDEFNSPSSVVQSLLGLILYIWVAAQATRFLADARRNGALELILCTPVTVAEVIRGQWMALFRMVWVPVAVILGMTALEQVQTWVKIQESLRAGGPSADLSMQAFGLFSSIGGMVAFLTNLLALGWFGMLMGLTSRKMSVALMKTFVLVQVLPWLAIAILQGMSLFLITWLSINSHWVSILAAVAFVGKDAAFIFWSRRKLHQVFRETAAQSFVEVRAARVPPLPIPATPTVPPIIPA